MIEYSIDSPPFSVLIIIHAAKSRKSVSGPAAFERGGLFIFHAVVLVNACDGEFDPLGQVDRVVADALEILCDHQQVQRDLALTGLAGNRGNQRLLDVGKILVDQIILLRNRTGQIDVPPDKGVHALRDHGAGLLRGPTSRSRGAMRRTSVQSNVL